MSPSPASRCLSDCSSWARDSASAHPASIIVTELPAVTA